MTVCSSMPSRTGIIASERVYAGSEAAAAGVWAIAVTQTNEAASTQPRTHQEPTSVLIAERLLFEMYFALLAGEIARAGHALPLLARVRAVAEGALLAEAAAAQADGGF